MTTKREMILVRLTEAGSKGVQKEDLQKEFGLSDPAVFSQMHMLRKKHKIRAEGATYFLDKPKQSPPPTASPEKKPGKVARPEGSSSPEILAHMQTLPEGISTKEMCEHFKISPAAAVSRIHFLRCKGHKIILKNGRYFVKSLTQEPLEKKKKVPGFRDLFPSTETAQGISLKKLLGDININDLNDLDIGARNDCLNNLRNSLVYRMTAEAIIQANKVIKNITE